MTELTLYNIFADKMFRMLVHVGFLFWFILGLILACSKRNGVPFDPAPGVSVIMVSLCFYIIFLYMA